jgi:HAD superfamily hydrolase (TIGR01549 family)
MLRYVGTVTDTANPEASSAENRAGDAATQAIREVPKIEAVIFDLDGTLIDSDEALVQAFLALGVPREEITFGHPIEQECDRRGFTVEQYVAAYDTECVQPFHGVVAMLEGLAPRPWAVCSNKHPVSARSELERLGWEPSVAMFSSDFGGGPKKAGPVADALGIARDRLLFVGDTGHDEQCAEEAGIRFALAGWNPRTAATASSAATVLGSPADLLDLLW